MQRIMDVVREVGRLEPWLPAIATHLKKQRPVQVHEDSAEVQDAVKLAHSHFPLSHPDDFEKENVRNVTREGSAIVNDAFTDEQIMGDHASGGTVEDEGVLAHRQLQDHDNVDNTNSADYTHLMLPPSRYRTQTQPAQPHLAHPKQPESTAVQERLSSALDRIKPRAPSLYDPPSTGNTPAHSQVSSREPWNPPSSRTLREHESTPTEQRTVKDTHLTVSQSAALEDSQFTIPLPYGEETHLELLHAEALKSSDSRSSEDHIYQTVSQDEVLESSQLNDPRPYEEDIHLTLSQEAALKSSDSHSSEDDIHLKVSQAETLESSQITIPRPSTDDIHLTVSEAEALKCSNAPSEDEAMFPG